MTPTTFAVTIDNSSPTLSLGLTVEERDFAAGVLSRELTGDLDVYGFLQVGLNPEIGMTVWGGGGGPNAVGVDLLSLPKIGLNLYLRGELYPEPDEIAVTITSPQDGATLDTNQPVTFNANAVGNPQLKLKAGVELTLRDGSVEEACPLANGRQVGSGCFRSPSDRHYFNRIRGNTPVKALNTVIMPDANTKVNNDVAQINQGQIWIRTGNTFISNEVQRRYVVVTSSFGDELSPEDDGDIDFFPMERGAYKALTILKKFKAGESQENMNGAINEINRNPSISIQDSQRALFVYQLGLSQGGNP